MTDTALVDTDVFSFLWQGTPEAAEYVDIVQERALALSFTSLGELWHGAYRAGWGDRLRASLSAAIRPYAVLPYARALSRLWGRLKAELEARGEPIGDNDIWIAATALHYDVPLITHNREHFGRVEDLTLLPDHADE